MLDIVQLRMVCRAFRNLPLHVARMDWPMVRACLRTDADKQTVRAILQRHPQFIYAAQYDANRAAHPATRAVVVAMHGTLLQIAAEPARPAVNRDFLVTAEAKTMREFTVNAVGYYNQDETFHGIALAFNTDEVARDLASHLGHSALVSLNWLNFTFLSVAWRGDPTLMRIACASMHDTGHNQDAFYQTLLLCAVHGLLAGYGRVPYNWGMLDAVLDALKTNKKHAQLAVVAILKRASPLLDADRAWRLFDVLQAYILSGSAVLSPEVVCGAFNAHIKYGAEETLRRFWGHPLFSPYAAKLLRHKTYRAPVGRIYPPNPKDPRVRDFKGALAHLDPLHRLGTAIFASPRPTDMARTVAELHPWGPAIVAHAITVAHICTGDRWAQNGLPPMTDERRRELCLEHVQRAMYPVTVPSGVAAAAE